MKQVLLLLALSLFIPQSESRACETTQISFSGNLNSATPVGGEPPSIFAPVEEQLAAAQVKERLRIYDSLGHSHNAVVAFYHIAGEIPWIARLIVDDENINVSNSSITSGDVYLAFDADGKRATYPRLILGAVYHWLNSPGINRWVTIEILPDNYAASTEVVVDQNGNAEGCPRGGSLDFDGDGADDLAVWRPEYGLWAILKSSSNLVGDLIFKQWGLPDDYPIPGDYTGDGKADLVLYRRTTATWYICKSELQFDCTKPQIVQFGLPGDIPVKGDYDGDGLIDFAVYRLNSNTFLYRSSRYGPDYINETQWGLNGDIPLQAAINQRPR